MAEMATAVNLLTNNSEITVVLNLNKANSSEGVPTLHVNVNSKVEFTKSLWSMLQSHKVQEPKMADQELLKTVYFSVLVQWLCPCHHFGMRYLICDNFDT